MKGHRKQDIGKITDILDTYLLQATTTTIAAVQRCLSALNNVSK